MAMEYEFQRMYEIQLKVAKIHLLSKNHIVYLISFVSWVQFNLSN